MPETVVDMSAALKFFDNYPSKSEKIVLRSVRKAATAAARTMKPAIPASARSIVRSMTRKSKNKDSIYAVVGLIVKKGRSYNEDNWKYFKAFWLSFGTLEKRNSKYNFREPRRKKTVYRRTKNGTFQYKKTTDQWKGGIQSRDFFPAAEKIATATYNSTLEKEYCKNVEKEMR